MSNVSVPAPVTAPLEPPPVAPAAARYDRSIIERPLLPAVWKIAWPTMLTNIIGGLQGIVDHALVGHLVGFKANAAIGVSPGRRRVTRRVLETTMNVRAIPRSAAALTLALALTGFLGFTGCSPKRFAINKVGDALANPGTTYAADDDPELIEQAAPFSLKLIESLLASSPRHEGLLLAAASGFTQYSSAFVQQRADFIEDSSLARAATLRTRARRLDLRARDYGLRGLGVRHAGFAARLRQEPRAAVRQASRADVPLLYWTAAAWGAAISVSKEIPEVVADQLIVEALIDRALELDEAFNAGAIHTFLVTYEMSRQGLADDPAVRSRRHFDRAVAITTGQVASPFVSYAEAVSLRKQDRAEFESMLKQALAIDPNAKPEWRLENMIMQQRARWLLARAPDLFLGAAVDTIPRFDGPPAGIYFWR